MARKDARGKGRKTRSRAGKCEPQEVEEEVPTGPPARSEAEKAAESHIRGILIRGEAAEAKDGTLPPGATHEIIEKDENGQPTKIVRRRFSIS